MIFISNFLKIDEESKSSPKIELYHILKVAIMSCRRTYVRRHKHNLQIHTFKEILMSILMFYKDKQSGYELWTIKNQAIYETDILIVL